MPVKGSEFNLDVDSVILAIGQKVDTAGLLEGLEASDRGFLTVDPDTMQTNVEGVFAGGDISGPSDAITAVRAGKEAAISIELYLAGVDPKEGRPPKLHRVEEVPKAGVQKSERVEMPMLGADKRNNFNDVELGLEEGAAQEECKRCLNCSVYAAKAEEEEEIRGHGIKISPGAYIHCLPIEAGFVGADNVGVLICEEPYKQDLMELIIDIGTNGELILGNKDKLISSSCATGPAFEGAEMKYGMRASPGAIEKIEINRKTKEVRYKVIDRNEWSNEVDDMQCKGICGSGIIDIVPQLWFAEIIDKTGKFIENPDDPRLRTDEKGEPEYVIAWAKETSIKEDVTITQGDIRNIQLAKAAMYAGVKLMMRRLGIETLDRVILAGAFGSFIDKVSAAALGLFPDCDLKNVYAVGNAAGDGCRWALLNIDKRDEANEMARKVEYVELTVEPDFEKVFMRAMWLPHMKDKFPHLEKVFSGESWG